MVESKMKTSIRGRILRLGILCAGVMGVILTVLSTYFFYAISVDDAEKFGGYVASSVLSSVDEEYEFIKEMIVDSGVTDESGSVFEKVFLYGEDIGYTYSDFSEQCDALQTGELAMSCQYTRSDGKAVILVAYKNGTETLVGEMLADYFDSILEMFMWSETNIGYIVNEEGAVLMSSGDSALASGNTLDGKSEFNEVMSGISDGTDGSFVINGESTGNTRYLVSSTTSPDSGLSVVYGENYNDVVSVYYTLLVMIIVVLLLLFTIAIVVSIGVAKAISVPLIDVTKRLAAFADGDIRSPFTPNKRGDETQILSESAAQVIVNIGNYIKDIEIVLQNISEGNLTMKSNMEYTGDFVKIRDSLDNITDSLRSIMSTIVSSGTQFATGSESVASGAKVLADNTIEEAATLENLNRMISNIKDGIDSNSSDTEKAYTLSNTVLDNVRQGNLNMEKMSEAMENIKTASEKIQAVVKLINDIAFQTNILALNAAVEAARAGEAGKGFAVVADEVRNLAAKSADAVRNTVGLITQCSEAVDEGTLLADNANESFRDISNSIGKFGALIERIASASEQQTKAIDEINHSIVTISDSIQSNSATAEESAAASDQLSSYATMLSEKVSYFKV